MPPRATLAKLVVTLSPMSSAMASSSKASWPDRHATMMQSISNPDVQTLLQHASDHSATGSHIRKAYLSTKGKARAFDDVDDQEAWQLQLVQHKQNLTIDIALALSWSGGRLPVPGASQPLQELTSAILAPSDFPSVTSLQRSSAAYVEIVRCRFNRQLYVLKSIVKGLARREGNRCSPKTEAKLLLAGHQMGANRRPTPDLLAAFQSQNSLHIVMQYFPAGDLDQLLHSAGEAGMENVLGGNGRLLDEGVVKAYAIDIVAAVGWCHEQGYAHRDIKPANFLLDRGGHLKLCDFASAAPFSLYDGQRRRIHHAFSCLAGTPDYIAPDILIAEEDRINATARNDRFTADDDVSISGFTSFSKSRLPVSEPEPESEGQYGPEIDWWSTGVVIYEMVYKNVPFWADSIREAHYRIRNHQQFLKLDEGVRIGHQLASLIRGLLCERDQRLGASIDGTDQVMQHPFFDTVDWNNYLDAPAPFVPNVSPATIDPAIPESPSCLHSPRPVAGRQSALADQSYSMTPESFQLSQIYEGNLEDFPAYESSRDGVIQEGSDEEEEDFGVAHTVYSEGNEQEQVKQTSPIVKTNRVSSSPVASKSLEAETFNWLDVDVTCLGFSAFPGADAFGSSSRTLPSRLASLPAMTPVISRMRSFTTIMEASPVCYSAATSPEVWMRQDAEGPTTSTPYAGRPNFSSPAMGANSSYRAPPTPLISSTPYGSAPKMLQRRILESAGRGAASPGDGFFATPLRKTSMPNVASAFRQGQTPAVPASPYPFPMAVRATPRTVERRGLASVSRSMRMTSQTPSYGQGMDSNADSGSRCSGGSNAKRDVSENEAMEQLMRVVAQSARKVRIEREDRAVNERLLALENTLAAKQGLESNLQQRLLKPTRPGLTHRSTDSALETTKEEIETGPWTASQRRGSAPGLSIEAIEEAKEEPESNDVAPPPPVVVSDLPSRPPRKFGFGQRKPSQALLNRLPSVPAPPVISLPTSVQVSSRPVSPDESSDSDSEPDSPLGSRPSSTMGGYFGRHASSSSSSTSHSSLAQAASSSSGAGHNNELRAPRMGLPQLRSRRSNRQLKMEAQERTTPTRPARVNSPFLNPPEFEMSRLSLGAEGAPSPSFRFEETGDNTPALSDGETSSGAEGEPLSADVSLLSNAGSRPSLQAAHHHTYPQVVRKSRLSLPALDAPVDIRSRSSSSGQLASMERPSSSASHLDEFQTDSGKQGRFSVESSSRGLRRKESRETLSEYRKGLVGSASHLQKGRSDGESSLGGVVNIDDAFGGGLATLPPALRKTLRRASVANLGREYDRATQSTSPPTTLITNENGKIASQSSQSALSATAGKGQGPRRRSSALPLHSSSINLRRSFMQSEDSIQEEASGVASVVPSGLTKNDVKDTNSPLTKMGQRYGGLNREMSRLEQRLASVKRRLAD